MGKKRDLWSAEGGTKSINRPQDVRIAKGWHVTPDVLPAKSAAPRRRKYAPIRPNNRAAVAVPLAGQSYNPEDDAHQAALVVSVKKLEKKRKQDAKFVKMMTLGRDMKIVGNFSADKTWEEEVKEYAPATPKKARTPEEASKTATEKRKKVKKAKKLGKRGTMKEMMHSLMQRRHPKRSVIAEETDELDAMLAQHSKQQEVRDKARVKRREAKKANMEVKHYGRHYHTPLALDVAPTDKLVGSLRHMSGGYVHPAMDRMKSLEERNLVPARMRHKYNRRRILKPKGEVRVKREAFGVLPETSF